MDTPNCRNRCIGQFSRGSCSLFALFFLGAALVPASARAEFAINLQPPASGLAQEIYDLHTLILWICAAIFIAVFVPMFVALVRHRKSLGHQPAGFHDNQAVEIAWTVIPTLILLGMAWPATRMVIAMKDTEKEDITIKVTGHQWKWEYEYLGDGIRFMSNSSTPKEQIGGAQPKGEHYLLEVDRPLVVPAGKKIRLVTTASDVIHSWAIPALGVKQDGIRSLLDEDQAELARRLDQAFGDSRGQLAALQRPFDELLADKAGRDQLNALYDSLDRLHRLHERELAKALDIQLGFNAHDGD